VLSGVVVAGLIALLTNVGPYRRNYVLFGSLLGPPEETGLYTNGIYSPTAVLSNVIRNVSLHLNTPVAEFNGSIEQIVIDLHSLMQINVNDPRTTYLANNYDFQYRLSTATRQEIYAGNSIHLIFIGLSSLIYVSGSRLFSGGRTYLLNLYMLAGLSMFALSCLVLKWQPFHSRQHLAFFLYFSPFIAVVVANTVKPSIMYGLAYGFLVLALPWVLLNSSRPLIPTYYVKQLIYSADDRAPQMIANQTRLYGVFSDKDTQLFREMEPLREPLVRVMDHLASATCRDFGLIEGTNTYQVEYPVWKLLERNFGNRFRLKHMLVANSSELARSNHPDFEPCIIISFSTSNSDQLNIDGNLYQRDFVASNAADGSCCTVSLYSEVR